MSCVCPSVTNRCSTEVAKCRITQTMPHDSPGTLVFWCRKSPQNSNRVILNGCSKCRWGRLNASVVAENWQLSTWGIVNLVWSQVYHTEHSPICLQDVHRDVGDSWSLLLNRCAIPQPKWHLSCFIHFCRAQYHDRQTDRPTSRQTTLFHVFNSRLRLHMHYCDAA